MLKDFNLAVPIEEKADDYEVTFKKIQMKLARQNDPTYLQTISRAELFDNVYMSKPALIEDFLYSGTYLFVGAPKLGKSFLMAQLAYHVSTGTKIWKYETKQATVLYLALEDDYKRLQDRLYRMFGTNENKNLHFCVAASHLGNGLDEQLNSFM